MKKELEKFRKFILEQSWTFAKSMPESPHEYIVKGKLCADDQLLFEEFVLFIRKYGKEKEYKKSTYVHFDIDGLSYWTMGAPLDKTIIINRHDLAFYNRIADSYDSLFSDIISQHQNCEILGMINPYLKGKSNIISILDVGCGSGLLLDLVPSLKPNYLGIDPAGAMLCKLSKKHPGTCLIQETFEDCQFDEDEKFDFIVSLFGAPSYINPSAFPKIKEILINGGKYFLMFYKPDYFPVTYQRTGKCFSHYKTDPEQLRREFEYIFEYSNYVCATNIGFK